jgi:ParB/RepB/Spo0J family partition protein
MNTAEQPTVAVDLIDVDDVNPRKHIDQDKLAQLAASIREHGVLQPVIVQANGGRYRLIAGQRRYLAAQIAELDEIPAVFRDDANDAARALSVVENLQREDLNPIEEAEAYLAAIHGGLTPGELSKAISVSEDTIKGRLQLLKLPNPVRERIADRTLPLNAAAALEVLAPAGEKVIAKAAELIVTQADYAEEQIRTKDLEDDPAWVLDTILDDLDDAPFLVGVRDTPRLLAAGGRASIPWPADAEVDVTALVEKAKRLPEYATGTYKPIRSSALTLDTEDVDAARAFGCLLELPGGRNDGPWINDPMWLADRLDAKLDTAIAKHEKKTKPKKGQTATEAGAKQKSADEQRKDRERKERATAKRKQLSAREKNITLGIKLYKELHQPKITADAMQLIAGVLLEYAADDLGRRGLRYIDETAQLVKTDKAGAITNVTHEKQVTALATLTRERLAKAKTAEQIVGALLQLLIAARHADVKAAPEADRSGGVRGIGGYTERAELVALIDKIAKPILAANPDTAEVVE